jgi:hypothetical protein
MRSSATWDLRTTYLSVTGLTNMSQMPENPRLYGFTYGEVVVITNTGGDTTRRLTSTVIHEAFHVAGDFMGHVPAAKLLELEPGKNGYPFTNAANLVSSWIEKCMDK